MAAFLASGAWTANPRHCNIQAGPTNFRLRLRWIALRSLFRLGRRISVRRLIVVLSRHTQRRKLLLRRMPPKRWRDSAGRRMVVVGGDVILPKARIAAVEGSTGPKVLPFRRSRPSGRNGPGRGTADPRL